MFVAQLRNELWKLFGKKRTYIGFAAFVVLQILMMLGFKYGHARSRFFEEILRNNGYLASEFITALTVSLVMLEPQIYMLMPLYATLVGGDIVAKESEDGTLRMILSRPISRLRLLFVKWSAGVIFATILVVALGITALGVARLMFHWGGLFVLTPGQAVFTIFPPGEGIARFAFSHLFLAINASAILSVAFMFSCFNMKPAAATILGLSYLFMSLVAEHIPFLESYQNLCITHHFACWRMVFQTPIPWSQILQSEIILVAISATAFVIGSIAFQVRDFKS